MQRQVMRGLMSQVRLSQQLITPSKHLTSTPDILPTALSLYILTPPLSSFLYSLIPMSRSGRTSRQKPGKQTALAVQLLRLQPSIIIGQTQEQSAHLASCNLLLLHRTPYSI